MFNLCRSIFNTIVLVTTKNNEIHLPRHLALKLALSFQMKKTV